VPRLAHVLATSESIRVLPTGPGRRRDLRVHARPSAGGPASVAELHAGQRLLVLPAGSGDDQVVTIHPCSLLRRLRHGRQRTEVTAADRPLRVVITGSGRCGTRALARLLDGLNFTDGTPVDARHEPLSEHAVPALIAGDLDTVRAIQRGLPHTVESAPYYTLRPDAITAPCVLHVVRDGRRVVQSGLNRGWYQNDSVWNRLKPDFPGDPFARACQLWRHTVETGLRISHATFRLEDLIGDAASRKAFCEAAGVAPGHRELPRSNEGRRSSRADHWNAQQRGVFAEIAGDLMDRLYPGWNLEKNPQNA
jgi:hypothetical protein